MTIRPLTPPDRPRIEEILSSTANFTALEIGTALELIDEALERGEESGYIIWLLEEAGPAAAVQGYVCFGPTPLTEGTYDLYWIAVHAASQRRGYGRKLLDVAEEEVRRRSGRLLVIETSSQEAYTATVRFYERSGYATAARVANFYKPGDDKLVLVKEMR